MSELATVNLDPQSVELLKPGPVLSGNIPAPSLPAHIFRERRLAAIPGYAALEATLLERRVSTPIDERPFLTPEGITETYDGTQFSGENHRRLTPLFRKLSIIQIPLTHCWPASMPAPKKIPPGY